MKITILGARGSVPTDGVNMSEFGGATSCVLVETKDQAMFLDAGTGIINPPDIGDKHISILISHPHMDHMIGLPFLPQLFEKDRPIDIYAVNRDGYDTRMQVDRLISPPLWPLSVTHYKAEVACHDIEGDFMIGDIGITCREFNHPGGVTIYRVSNNGHSLVYATDYEHDDENLHDLIDFSYNTDLLLYDAQYTEDEYQTKTGFGHSTAEYGLYVMQQCHAAMLRFIHHDPRHDDSMLKEMEDKINDRRILYARKGEVITL